MSASNERPLTRDDLRYELQHYATKADLAELEARLIKWMIGLMVGAVAVAASVAVAVQRLTS